MAEVNTNESGVLHEGILSEYVKKSDYWRHMTAIGSIAGAIVLVLSSAMGFAFSTIRAGFTDVKHETRASIKSVRDDVREVRSMVQQLTLNGKRGDTLNANQTQQVVLGDTQRSTLMRLPYWDTSQAALMLGVNADTIRRRIEAGRLQAEKVDGRWKIPRAAIVPDPVAFHAQNGGGS